jgi:hypothetical protein
MRLTRPRHGRARGHPAVDLPPEHVAILAEASRATERALAAQRRNPPWRERKGAGAAPDHIPSEARMLSTVETRVRYPGRIGYHMEDLFLVTDGASELLSDAFDNEEILTV